MDPVLGVIIVGIVGPLLTYLVAAKKLTGEVKTSDASELWAESRSIREWSADRIAQLTGIITALETRVNEVEKRNRSLATENDVLLLQIKGLTDTIDGLRKELVTCSVSVETLNQQLAKSQARVDVLEDQAADPQKDAND